MEELKSNFTKEEIEIIKTLLLERSTFYTKKIVEYKVLQLKTENAGQMLNLQSNIDFNYKYKNTIDKLHFLLGD